MLKSRPKALPPRRDWLPGWSRKHAALVWQLQGEVDEGSERKEEPISSPQISKVRVVKYCKQAQLPLVNQHGNWNPPFSLGDAFSLGPFSLAMLVYFRLGQWIQECWLFILMCVLPNCLGQMFHSTMYGTFAFTGVEISATICGGQRNIFHMSSMQLFSAPCFGLVTSVMWTCRHVDICCKWERSEQINRTYTLTIYL